jgi:hypothetical protein
VLPHYPPLRAFANSTAVQVSRNFRRDPDLSAIALNHELAHPAMNLNDMPHSGVLIAAVSRGSVLFGQQARQFLQASLASPAHQKAFRASAADAILKSNIAAPKSCCGGMTVRPRREPPQIT